MNTTNTLIDDSIVTIVFAIAVYLLIILAAPVIADILRERNKTK